jgi:hypothetical protein
MAEKIDHPQFMKMLRHRFPLVADRITDCSAGLLHLEMATLSDATIDAIREGDAKTVAEYFAFVDEMYRDADAAVANAVNVSYLEHIDFKGPKAKAIHAHGLLTTRLQQAVQELEEYWEELSRSAAQRQERGGKTT